MDRRRVDRAVCKRPLRRLSATHRLSDKSNAHNVECCHASQCLASATNEKSTHPLHRGSRRTHLSPCSSPFTLAALSSSLPPLSLRSSRYLILPSPIGLCCTVYVGGPSFIGQSLVPPRHTNSSALPAAGCVEISFDEVKLCNWWLPRARSHGRTWVAGAPSTHPFALPHPPANIRACYPAGSALTGLQHPQTMQWLLSRRSSLMCASGYFPTSSARLTLGHPLLRRL